MLCSYFPARIVTVAGLHLQLGRPALDRHTARSLIGLGHRWCSDERPPVPKKEARYPQRYFDFKAFREGLKEKKENLSEAELREIRREYALPPPNGWTVLDFLQHMKFGDGAEDVANRFDSWADFISMSPKDIMRIPGITATQRRVLSRHITLFVHGLWPVAPQREMLAKFGGVPLQNDGKPWTQDEDEELRKQAKRYDVSFGDPWIYLSWELGRTCDDVRERYVEKVVKEKEMKDLFEIAVTKASRPLHMNRKFRMIPSDLYIVPSEANFRLAKIAFKLPAAFEKYRQEGIF